MSTSALAGVADQSRPGAVWARRTALAAVTLFVAADLAGLLGVHTRQVAAEGHGYRLSVSYPAMARAGLDVTWQVEVVHAGGFARTLTIAVSGGYFDIFESQGFHPEPESTTRSGGLLLLTFAAPPGDTFRLDYDAYIQPASQVGRSAHLDVVRNGRSVVGVQFTTHLVP